MNRKFSAQAAEMKRQGYPEHRIIQELINKGVGRDAAYEIIADLSTSDDDGQRAAARQKMVTGGLICLLGILITIVTYGVAASNGGGTYVVAVGMIFGGGIRLLQGFSTYSH